MASLPPTSTAPSPSGSAAPQATHTPGPSPTPRAPQHRDPKLEALIPASIDGVDVRVQSVGMAEFMAALDPESLGRIRAGKFLSGTGTDPTATNIAFAVARSPHGDLSFEAIHAPGALPSRLLSAAVSLARASQADPTTVTVTTVQLGGKTVVAAKPADAAADPWYVYMRGDIVFILPLPEATASIVLGALP